MDSMNQCTGLRPNGGGVYFRCLGAIASQGRCTACLAFRQPQSAVEGGCVHRCGYPKKTGAGGPCQSAVEHLGARCVHHDFAAATTLQRPGQATPPSARQKTINHFFKPVARLNL